MTASFSPHVYIFLHSLKEKNWHWVIKIANDVMITACANTADDWYRFNSPLVSMSDICCLKILYIQFQVTIYHYYHWPLLSHMVEWEAVKFHPSANWIFTKTCPSQVKPLTGALCKLSWHLQSATSTFCTGPKNSPHRCYMHFAAAKREIHLYCII